MKKINNIQSLSLVTFLILLCINFTIAASGYYPINNRRQYPNLNVKHMYRQFPSTPTLRVQQSVLQYSDQTTPMYQEIQPTTPLVLIPEYQSNLKLNEIKQHLKLLKEQKEIEIESQRKSLASLIQFQKDFDASESKKNV